MLKEIIILVFTLAVCHADTPAPSYRGVSCGRMPENIYSCMGNPTIITLNDKCAKRPTPCDQMKCRFAESGWLSGYKVDKKKVSDYFTTVASTYPNWSTAVAYVKYDCLGEFNLPAQGAFLNCPEYDIMHCALINFIKNTSPSQWRPGAECARAREYADTCPVCPEECFAAQVPKYSCNACISTPAQFRI